MKAEYVALIIATAFLWLILFHKDHVGALIHWKVIEDQSTTQSRPLVCKEIGPWNVEQAKIDIKDQLSESEWEYERILAWSTTSGVYIQFR